MNNGKIFYFNIAPSAEITCTETPGFEKKYLTDTNQGTLYLGGANESIVFANGSPTPCKGVAVFNHTYETLTFQGATDAAFTDPESVTLNISTGYVEVDWNFAFYRLICTTTQDAGYIGQVYLLGKVYEFEQNFKWRYSYRKDITRISRETKSGQVYRKTQYIRYGYDLEFEGISDTQKEIFEAISEDEYICFLPTGTGGSIYYGYIDFTEYRHLSPNYHECSAKFVENPK